MNCVYAVGLYRNAYIKEILICENNFFLATLKTAWQFCYQLRKKDFSRPRLYFFWSSRRLATLVTGFYHGADY